MRQIKFRGIGEGVVIMNTELETVEAREITADEVEEILQQIHDLESEVSEAAKKRDTSIGYFQSRIAKAELIYENETKFAKAEIASLSYSLEVWLKNNMPKKKKSLNFAGGKIGFSKQPPKYFIGESEVKGTDKTLLEVVKKIAPEYVKTKTEEYTDWKNFKGKLSIDGDAVYYADTGEVIAEMRGQILPDKFTVETA